jgi:transketolase
MEQARFGRELSDHAVWVIVGDGCLQEGISQEAIDLAGHLQLPNLVVLWDDNRISIDGATSVSTSTDQCARFRASGWAVMMVDGHDHQAVAAVLAQARDADRPVMVACRTEIGRGAPTVCGTEKAHGAPLGADGCAAARAALGWVHEPFAIPCDTAADWRDIAARGGQVRAAWQARLDASSEREAFNAFHSAFDCSAVAKALADFRAHHRGAGTRVATRQASQLALAAINHATEMTIGGSADLTHSNLTLTKGLDPVRATNFAGRYIHYGIREHAMAAVMNGIALHGGFIPYGGTFLSFADYARGAIRLSALMGVRVIYVMTHDSIGLGEDGPTHQPIEHLAMLRATPNLAVYRPADVIETAEAWELALADARRPSVLVLSRQALPMLRSGDAAPAEATGRGGYILRQPEGPRDVTLIATGSEVEIAVAAALILGAQGIAAVVVSLPCWERFEAQEASYRAEVLGSAPRVAVEAAARLGWDRWIGDDGAFVGMTGFGASAPAADLYQHFGITAEAVAAAARMVIDGRISA